MKKINVSILALLGVVIAVMSAFTSVPVNDGGTVTYKWYANVNHSTGELSPTDLRSQNVEVTTLPANPLPSQSEQQEIDEYAAEHCPDAPPVCIALIKMDDGSVAEDAELLLIKFGRFE